MFCRLATSQSQCPHNWNTFTGGNGPLDPAATCETDYDGCYIKQNVNIPVSSTTTRTTTTSTSTSTSTTTPTTSEVLPPATMVMDCDSPYDEVTSSGMNIMSPNHPQNYN